MFSTQSQQNVHSNVQIIASVAEGGKSLLQHSQLGRNSSMLTLLLCAGTRDYLMLALAPASFGFSRRFKFGRFRAAAESRRESFGRK
jgi:hypothetical protein